ncbi:MAG: helix-turn-helix domain-containing protein [Zhengella sp.]|uniref:helix-turn-helix domain-containing protein n=1 Tax=Zhengella sp. TaxID=2282762 RepID=UPI0035297BFD
MAQALKTDTEDTRAAGWTAAICEQQPLTALSRFRLPAPLPKRRDEYAAAVCDGMIDLAAELFNVPGRELRAPGRNVTAVVRVRQLAMYVAHVALQLTMGEVGKGFGRDRTTVVHACHLIEDLRDDADFDAVASRLERAATCLFGRADEDRSA